VSRGQVFKSNEHTNIVHEVLCLKILRVTQKGGSNLSWEAWIGVKLEREREVLSSRKVVLRCFQNSRVGNRVKGAWWGVIATRRNLPVGVSETRTCPGWGPYMSGNFL
jgi:hypothetical protein